ncbi:MAG: L-seryl-tRNA(Sec) selenium transferase [Planctomycetota bacterium]|nr:L-seryl-tRNA(Sec) selenium transferase [Planctomycetota bacterium]MEC9351885.1 L-seryl-tRNA(Sec) selenium transferase [Planctomycetota bacterium]MEE3199337.1 L-seryl-tRNA(Sec) selenium transferase [Planctomycetota bacterium]
MTKNLLKTLPQVEKALQWPEISALCERCSRSEITRVLRTALDEIRSALLSESLEAEKAERIASREGIVARLRKLLAARLRSSYRRVINGTGVLLHTGLGRSVLSAAAVDAFRANHTGYSIVEVDGHSGERNQREGALRELLCELTGAESATVVNNNAAATLLILGAFARGKEVIVSRGQLVEIGGSFRVPDIMEEGGARLVEVGTTNRTYVKDFEAAITPQTGMLLEVHTSNYAIRGFAHHTPLEDLVELGADRGLPVASDLGSGCFLDMMKFGFEHEPLVRDKVLAGPEVVCFSGDKLLGGPQAGIIVGKKDAVEKVRAHPLFRALRVDKVSLTLLEATLRLYRNPEQIQENIPILRMLSSKAESLKEKADAFAAEFKGESGRLKLEVIETSAQTGSGSLPDQAIPSWGIAMEHSELNPRKLSEALRSANPPVFTRVHGERVLIDFRTLLDGDTEELTGILKRLV